MLVSTAAVLEVVASMGGGCFFTHPIVRSAIYIKGRYFINTGIVIGLGEKKTCDV
jgi:hypothetical protein